MHACRPGGCHDRRYRRDRRRRGAGRPRRRLRTGRRRTPGDHRRPGAGTEPRRSGVLVLRWAVLRRLTRAAAAADQGLARTRLAGLARLGRLRPPGRPGRTGSLAAPLGRGVRRLRGRREARLAARARGALVPGGRLGRARGLPRERARQLGAALPRHLGHRSGARRAVRRPGARGRGGRAAHVRVPASGRRPDVHRRCGRRRSRHGARAVVGCRARRPVPASRSASSSCTRRRSSSRPAVSAPTTTSCGPTGRRAWGGCRGR